MNKGKVALKSDGVIQTANIIGNQGNQEIRINYYIKEEDNNCDEVIDVDRKCNDNSEELWNDKLNKINKFKNEGTELEESEEQIRWLTDVYKNYQYFFDRPRKVKNGVRKTMFQRIDMIQ